MFNKLRDCLNKRKLEKIEYKKKKEEEELAIAKEQMKEYFEQAFSIYNQQKRDTKE